MLCKPAFMEACRLPLSSFKLGGGSPILQYFDTKTTDFGRFVTGVSAKSVATSFKIPESSPSSLGDFISLQPHYFAACFRARCRQMASAQSTILVSMDNVG